MTLDTIPSELQIHILTFCDLRQLGRIARVSNHWKQLSEQDVIWKNLYLKTVGFITANQKITKEYCKKEGMFKGIQIKVIGKFDSTGTWYDSQETYLKFIPGQFGPEHTIADLLILTIQHLFFLKKKTIATQAIRQKGYLSAFMTVTGSGQLFAQEFDTKLNKVKVKDYIAKYFQITFSLKFPSDAFLKEYMSESVEPVAESKKEISDSFFSESFYQLKKLFLR